MMPATEMSTMHPRIAELAQVLVPMIDKPSIKPTSVDRNRLVAVREKIKRLPEELQLDGRDEADQQYLYVEATRLANQQEAFYEQNGNKWEPMTKEQLLAMGGDAPLDEVLKAFDIGGLSSFANKELPVVRRALRIRTIGGLAAHHRSQISGPQCRNCGNKTLEWIDIVCREFKIESPEHGEPHPEFDCPPIKPDGTRM